MLSFSLLSLIGRGGGVRKGAVVVKGNGCGNEAKAQTQESSKWRKWEGGEGGGERLADGMPAGKKGNTPPPLIPLRA